MYIKEINIQNIRSISELTWSLPDNDAAGWHVVIGDNGSGKSSFLRSIALALIGPFEASALGQDWNTWLRSGQDTGQIKLNLLYDKEIDQFSMDEKVPLTSPHNILVNEALDRIYLTPTIDFKRSNGEVVFGWQQATGRY